MIHKLIVQNLANKLLAVGLAIVVWILLNESVVTQEKPDTQTGKARLTVLPPRGVGILKVTTNDEKGEEIGGPTGVPLQVTLRGPRRELQNLIPRGIECRHLLSVELSSLSARETVNVTGTLRSWDFDLPRGIEVVRIEPEEIRVQVAQAYVRPLRIADNPKECLRGNLPAGFQVERVSFEPTFVHVRGLRITLDRLSSIPIVPVEINDRTESFSQQVRIQDEIQGRPVTTDERIVMTVTIRPADVEKPVPNLRVELVFPAAFPLGRDRVHVTEPVVVKAILRGPAQAVEALAMAGRIRVLAEVPADLAPKAKVDCPLRPFVGEAGLASQVTIRFDPPRAVLEATE